jgi:outer membrane lipoprotein-sorting protein
MKKIFAGIFGMLFLATAGISAQELKLDDVLSRYYNASGLTKQSGWKTITCVGKTIGDGSEYPYRVYIKRPGKVRTEIEIQKTNLVTAWDGKSGWSVSPWNGSLDPQDMTPDESKGLKYMGDIEGPLFGWKEKGYKAELVGKEVLEGTPVYNIKLLNPDGDIQNYFIDAGNFMLLKITFSDLVMGNKQEHEQYLTNYREVDGVFLPFAVTEKYIGHNSEGSEQVVFTEILVNRELNDSLFVKPVVK